MAAAAAVRHLLLKHLGLMGTTPVAVHLLLVLQGADDAVGVLRRRSF